MGIRLAAIAGAVIGLMAHEAGAACQDNAVFLRGDFGSARFTVDVVDTPEGRAQGLMFVEDMPRSSGMLFVFDDAARRTFWMKNTLIPLDILYFDSEGVLLNTAARAVPGDLTPLPSLGPARYVLEINGGLAAAMGITPGTELQHPRIETPSWPCDGSE